MKIWAVLLAVAVCGLTPGNAQAAPIVIPMSMVNSHIEIPVTLNGQPMMAILDSGAANSEIDLGLAHRFGLKIEPPGPASPAAEPTAAPSAPSGAGWLMEPFGILTVGDWSSREPAWVEDLGSMIAMGQPPMIIGDDLFRAFVVELDFDAGKVVLHDRAQFQAPAGATMLPVQHAGFGYATPIEIEGGGAKLANIDLGANASLMLAHAYAQQRGVLDRPGATSRGCLGILGEQGCQTGLSASEVKLGAFSFHDVPIVVPAAGDPVFRNIDANLGLGLLSRFHLWLDFTGERLWLTPTAHITDPYEHTIGCAFRSEGQALVAVGVVSGGPAAAAGLKSGDRIAAVDGVRGAEAMTRAITLAQRGGSAISFELEDGRRLTVKPGDRV